MTALSLSRDTQPLWWHCEASEWTSSQPSVAQKVLVNLGSGAGTLMGGMSSVPLMAAALWDKHRGVLQSLSSTAQDSLPPCPATPAGPGWDVPESSIFRSRRKLLPPLPELLDSVPKAFGVAGD